MSRSGYRLYLEEVQSEQWVVFTAQSMLGAREIQLLARREPVSWQDSHRPPPSTASPTRPLRSFRRLCSSAAEQKAPLKSI